MKGTVIYKYVGNGASLVGVPARDLTEQEADDYGKALLLASGLYKKETRHGEQPGEDLFDEEDLDDLEED